MRAWSMVLAALAGLYGAAGVVLAAAGAHLAAGPTVTTAAYFLLFHAAALIAVCASVPGGRRRAATAVLIAASLWAVGVFLFSGDLALHALTGKTPVRQAAPAGGILLIAGWLVAAVALPMRLAAERFERI